MTLQIPGYYFDAEKNKYFKIEKTHTAPPAASWSSDAVKKRLVQDGIERTQRRRAELLKRHIRRHVLTRNVVSSGLVTRETEMRRVSEPGVGRGDDGDIGATAWAHGVVDKGRIPFVPSFARSRFAHMPCFYVGNEDTKTGLGVAYASLDEETLVGSYIHTDEGCKIAFSPDAPSSPGRTLSFRTEMIRCPQLSSINYHRPSHKILLTSREPDHSCGVYFFSPLLSDGDDGRPLWLLGETEHYRRLSIRHRLHDNWLVHRSTPAPPSSDLLCVIGTNAGVLRVRSNETMAWIAPQSPAKSAKIPREVFDQDFQQDNHNILLAGGRQTRLWISDLRMSETEWMFVKHASSIAHLRSVNQHQILVAGLENSMSLYDMRYFSKRPNGVKPLLSFPGYKNDAHFHTGWDVCPELNVVASAQDNGTVKLFSLRSGRTLQSRALEGVKSETPVKAMMFQRLPREKLPSLFVGDGASLRKFSFGACGLEDEA